MLTEAQKGDIRRFLKYPAAGLLRNSPAGGSLADGAASWRFWDAYGFLEYKLNNLSPTEECRLTGNAYGAIAVLGPNPTPGDFIQITITGGGLGSAQNVVATAAAGDTLLNLIAKLAQNALLNTALTNAGFFTVAPFGTGPFAQTAIPLPELAFINPQAFNLAVSFTGNTAPQLTANGSILGPTATVDPSTNPATVRNGYIPILLWLEGAHAGSTQNLDTLKADVWTARPTETKERGALLSQWRIFLSQFLGVPINPKLRATNSGMRSVV